MHFVQASLGKFILAFSFIPLAFSLSACGVLLGKPYRIETETIVARSPVQPEPWRKAYAASITASFDAKSLVTQVQVRVVRNETCRRVSVVEVSTQSSEGTRLDRAGLSLDAGAFLAGLIGSFLTDQAAVKGAVILVAAVPLAIDGIKHVSVQDRGRSVTKRIEPEPGAGTHQAGEYACGATGETQAEMHLGDKKILPQAGVYRFQLSEDEALALGDATHLQVPLVLVPRNLPEHYSAPEKLVLRVGLGQRYAAFRLARDEAKRFVTFGRIADYLANYPASTANSRLRENFLALLPAARDADELRAISGLEKLDGALRRAAHERFTVVRLEALSSGVPAQLEAALQAERDANTFFLNHYDDSGRARLAEQKKLLADVCRIAAELKLRDQAGDEARLELWRKTIENNSGAAAARKALQWVALCR